MDLCCHVLKHKLCQSQKDIQEMNVLWGMRTSLCCRVWMLKNSCPDFMLETPYQSVHCPFFYHVRANLIFRLEGAGPVWGRCERGQVPLSGQVGKLRLQTYIQSTCPDSIGTVKKWRNYFWNKLLQRKKVISISLRHIFLKNLLHWMCSMCY